MRMHPVGWICVKLTNATREYIATFSLMDEPPSGVARSAAEWSGAKRSSLEWSTAQRSGTEPSGTKHCGVSGKSEWLLLQCVIFWLSWTIVLWHQQTGICLFIGCFLATLGGDKRCFAGAIVKLTLCSAETKEVLKNLCIIFLAILEMTSILLLLAISKRVELLQLQLPDWHQKIGNPKTFRNLTNFWSIHCF